MVVRRRIQQLFYALVAAACLPSLALATTITWTGGGANSNWNNAANWTGSLLSLDLDPVFPATASRKTNINDFSAGLNVSLLTFSGTGYAISGSSIDLSAGINATIPAAGTFVFEPPILLTATQAFTSAGAAPYTLGGTVNLNGRALTLNGSGGAALNGNIIGTGALTKSGSGTVVLNGTSTGFGTTTIAGGTLEVAGAIGNVTLSGGTLAGSGTVGNVDASAGPAARTIAPGSGNTFATLTAAIVTLAPTATLAIDIPGGIASIKPKDRLATTSINLNGAPLALTLGGVPANNVQFTIVTGAVTGQFAQGGSITASGRTFAITYTPTTVVLTALPSTRIWSGAGANSNWTNGDNWVGNAAPIAGDDLEFPDVALGKTNTNDFPAGTAFGSLTMTGASYLLSGNQIDLRAGLLFNTPAGGTSHPGLLMPIRLTAAQSFVNNGAQPIFLSGGVDIDNFALVVSAANFIFIQGNIIGAGGITKTGPNGLKLTGPANSYSGITQVSAGSLILSSNGAAGSAVSGTIIASGATLTIQNDTTHAEPLTLNGGSPSTSLVAQLCATACTMSGPITLAADSTVGTFNSGDKLILGPVGQSGGSRKLTLTGPGTVVMTGTSTHAGGTVVSTGTTLLVDGSVGIVNIANSRLGGSGSVVGITGSGTIAPGASAGILTVAGNLALANASKLEVDIGGPAVGSQYDRLVVNGTTSLNGATLQGALIGGFTPVPGTQFTILQSIGALTGQFAQGNSVTFNGVAFDIAYGANSVVLTAAAAPAAPDLTVSKTHVGNFTRGQVGATFTAIVTNSGAGAKGNGALVTLTESPPLGLTVTSMTGTGWSCAALTCTRSDAVAGFSSYPPVTIVVSVASDAPTQVVNSVSVTTTATEGSTANNSASDPAVVVFGTQLTVTKAGSGAGVVTSADLSISCSPTCANAFVPGSLVTLTATAGAGSVFTGWLGPCTGTGSCAVTVGSVPIVVSATFAPSGTILSVDIDLSSPNTYDALTDGLLVIRYLVGLTGAALTNGALGSGATVTDPTAVAGRLDDVRPLLDVDGNGRADALTDGLMLIRYMFGLRGAALTAGAIGGGGARSDAASIEAYIQGLMP